MGERRRGGMGTLIPPRPSGSVRHADEIRRRLRRTRGQVNGITRTYEQGRLCPDVLDQVAAARAALDGLGQLMLDDHVRGCLEPVVRASREEAKAARPAARDPSVHRGAGGGGRPGGLPCVSGSSRSAVGPPNGSRQL